MDFYSRLFLVFERWQHFDEGRDVLVRVPFDGQVGDRHERGLRGKFSQIRTRQAGV